MSHGLNKNKLARMKQNKVLMGIVLAVIVIGFALSVMMPKNPHRATSAKQQPDMTGMVDSDFTVSATHSAVSELSGELGTLQNKLDQLSKQMSKAQNAMQLATHENKTAISALSQSVKKAAVVKDTATPHLSGQFPSSEENSENGLTAPVGIQTTAFHYQTTTHTKTHKKTPTTYVPPGTFARAVVLGGADTNAGVNGQNDTKPVLLKILDNGTLPNHFHSSLKNCLLTAAAYGDASSDRGEIRLQRLSCVRKNGQILDIPVEGTIDDMGGKNGLRGHVVMRNGKLLWNAGLSGFLSGIGSAMQSSMTTQSTSALGTTTSVDSGHVFGYGAYGGANTALGKLADYYIKLAELYHPVIELDAGNLVDVWFQQGFWLDPNQAVVKKKASASETVSNVLPPSLLKSIQSARLGDAVNAVKQGAA